VATESMLVLRAAILAIAATKFTARHFTDSSAMISQGIHSLVDAGNGGLNLLGSARSRKPAESALELFSLIGEKNGCYNVIHPDID
jgi:divalent metal cation (Fe/Co/Zn/Cd) transporter